MPLLFAGGVCWAALAVVDGPAVLAGAGVVAGLLEVADGGLLAAGADADW
jgi:hypothetical protein